MQFWLHLLNLPYNDCCTVIIIQKTGEKSIGMHITYGIIYYFLIVVVCLTGALSLFLLRPLRAKLVWVSVKGGFNLDNQIIYTSLYFTFAVLLAVLIDSGWAFKELYQSTDSGNTFNIQTIQSPIMALLLPTTTKLELFTRRCICHFIASIDNISLQRGISF